PPLDTYASRHLANREALAHAASADVGHDGLEDLGAFLFSLDHPDVDLDRVSRAEFHLPVRLEPVLEPLDRAHRPSSFFISSSSDWSSSLSFRPSKRSGRLSQVRRNASRRRHMRIRS